MTAQVMAKATAPSAETRAVAAGAENRSVSGCSPLTRKRAGQGRAAAKEAEAERKYPLVSKLPQAVPKAEKEASASTIGVATEGATAATRQKKIVTTDMTRARPESNDAGCKARKASIQVKILFFTALLRANFKAAKC